MKQSIKTIATALSLSLGFCTFSFAQEMGAANSANSETATAASDNNTSENMARATFSSMFPNATQQKWTSAGGNNFVSFINDGRKATGSFNAKGSCNYIITTCVMGDLPPMVSKSMKGQYGDYQLSHAMEIKAHGETAYQAVMENGKSFLTLKFTADGVEEIQRVKK